MSADNGFVIRKDDQGKFVLQMYFQSADEYPPITEQTKRYEALEDAVLDYEKTVDEYDKQGIPVEYGLTVYTGDI